jgi:hypothetical protein
MAQEAAWLDAEHFAIGRWDGSLSVFRFDPGMSAGPLISTTASSPSSEGVQMITWLSPRTFASSNDAGSMIVWWPEHGSAWAGLRQTAVLRYDASFGEANSGDAFALGTHLYLVAGHANGYLTIWSGTPQGHDFHLVRSVDVRSAQPVNPWNLHNVRGIHDPEDGRHRLGRHRLRGWRSVRCAGAGRNDRVAHRVQPRRAARYQ